MANLDLSATLELIDRISAPLQSIVAQSERLNQAFEKTTASVEQFNETLSKVNSSRLNGLNQPLNQTNSLFSKAREHARGLASDLKLVFSAIVGVQKKSGQLIKIICRLPQRSARASDGQYRQDGRRSCRRLSNAQTCYRI